MESIYSYNIDSSQHLPYWVAIEKDLMQYYEATNEIIASSRIYFICRIRKPTLLSRILSKSKPHPEVLYVGETFNKASRYEQHKQLLKATAITGYLDELRIYFIQTKGILGGSSFGSNTLQGVLEDLKGFYSKEATWLLERLYIKLFKPILNDPAQFDKKIEQDKFVKQKLLANGISYVHLNIGMKEKEYQFWSPGKESEADWHYFNLKTGELYEGVPDFFPD